MKYTITLYQNMCGNIEVEADNREEAKKMAIKLATEDSNNVDWFESKEYIVVEVEEEECR